MGEFILNDELSNGKDLKIKAQKVIEKNIANDSIYAIYVDNDHFVFTNNKFNFLRSGIKDEDIYNLSKEKDVNEVRKLLVESMDNGYLY
jgi:hypothetical protein